jgi:hypothetical protein
MPLIRQGSAPGGDPPKPPDVPPGPSIAPRRGWTIAEGALETSAGRASGFATGTLSGGNCPVVSSRLLYWPVRPV